MRSLMFLECVFPRVRFCTIREGAIMPFRLMFGAFAMAVKIAFLIRFIAAFESTAKKLGAGRNERRFASTTFRRT